MTMASFKEYADYDAVGLSDLVRRRDVQASEVLDAALDRIAEFNPAVNAVSILMEAEARETVKKGVPTGPFEGVPFLLKDLDTGNYPGVATTLNSRLLENYIPDHSSYAVERSLKAGLVCAGKTNIPNFGVSATTEPKYRGPTRNPWNLNFSAGGSTGGGAAAVAIGMVPMAQATDAAGSLRLPASHCGLFGLKVSRGRISAGPDLGEFAGGMGSVHVITRSVRDSAVMLDQTEGPGIGDPYYAPRPERPYAEEAGLPAGRLRIAFSAMPPVDTSLHPACATAVKVAAKLCEDLGHDLVEGAPVYDFWQMCGDFPLIHGATWSSRLQALIKASGRPVEPEDAEVAALGWAALGQTRTAAEYADAIKRMHMLGRKIGLFFQNYDLLLTPVASAPALPLGVLDTNKPDFEEYVRDLFRHMAFTTLANLTGQPAMSIPIDWAADDLPVGVQFQAAYGREDVLFRLAAQIEEARPWSHRRPKLWTDGKAGTT